LAVVTAAEKAVGSVHEKVDWKVEKKVAAKAMKMESC
jgi:hypothetical protein